MWFGLVVVFLGLLLIKSFESIVCIYAGLAWLIWILLPLCSFSFVCGVNRLPFVCGFVCIGVATLSEVTVVVVFGLRCDCYRRCVPQMGMLGGVSAGCSMGTLVLIVEGRKLRVIGLL
jgi:hypothetical protein